MCNNRWSLALVNAAQQGQLWRIVFNFAIDLQSLGICLFGQLALDVRQISVRSSIAGVCLQGFFEVGSRVFQLAFGSIQNAQVVVGLGQVRIGLGEFFECVNGLVCLTLLRLDHAFQESQLYIFRCILFFLLNKFQCLVQLS